MEELYLTSEKPKNGLFVNDSPVLDGVWLHHNSWGMNIPTEKVEDLHAWLTQWLKENPKKVEARLIISKYRDPFIVHDDIPLTDLLDPKAHPIAVVPISYHIGQGLNTPEESDNE